MEQAETASRGEADMGKMVAGWAGDRPSRAEVAKKDPDFQGEAALLVSRSNNTLRVVRLRVRGMTSGQVFAKLPIPAAQSSPILPITFPQGS